MGLEIAGAIVHINAYKNRSEGDPWLSIRNFLDDFFANINAEIRQQMIWERPEFTGDIRFDAYLAALAEYLSYHYKLRVSDWANEKERFLNKWWFPTEFNSLHAIAIVESPASFRRRGIFIDKTEFQRV